MFRQIVALVLCMFSVVSIASAQAKNETVTIVIKDLIAFDGSMVIKPEGGGKALTLSDSSNNKVFTAAKMDKIHKAHEDKTPIKFLVNDTKILDILE